MHNEYGKTASKALCIHATLLVCVWQENAQKYTITTEAGGREGAYITLCRCPIPFSLESAFQTLPFLVNPCLTLKHCTCEWYAQPAHSHKRTQKHFPDCGMTWQSKSPLPKRRLHWQKPNLPTRALGRDRPAQTIFKRFRLFFFYMESEQVRNCEVVTMYFHRSRLQMF